jgi:hypothetical protein
MDQLALHSELEHLIGEDRGVDDGGPRSDLELALLARDRRSKCSRRIQKGLGRFRAAHANLSTAKKQGPISGPQKIRGGQPS